MVMLQGRDVSSIDTLINEYITEYSEKKTTNQTERKIRNIIRNDPERAWKMIFKLIESVSNEEILVKIGVGPLEDLLSYHSNKLVEKVEMEIKNNEKFANTMQYVWKRNMSEEVWQRIQRAIQEQWKDDIIIMQKLFRNQSFNLGEENGVIGPKTQEAIEQLRIKTGVDLESIEEIIEQLKRNERVD
jgi:acetoin utilization deacetylase AcuC-like enzyme